MFRDISSIEISVLCYHLSQQAYNEHCIVNDTHGILATPEEGGTTSVNDLYLAPNKMNKYSFTFLPQADDVGKTLEVSSIVSNNL